MNRMIKAGTAALVLGGLALTTHAGALRSGVVSKEATWVAHVNIEALVGSTIGQALLSEDGPADLHELDEIEAELGLNPLEEIFSLTAFGIGEDEGTFTAVLETSGAIESVWDKLEEEAGEHYRRIREGGLTVHVIDKDEKTIYAAETSTGRRGRRAVVVSQSLELVVSGAERLGEGGGGRLLGGRGPRDGSLIFIAAREIPGMAAHHGPASALLQSARGVRLDVGENGDEVYIRAAVRTDDAEKAQKAAQAAQGLLAFAQLMAPEEPEIAQYVRLLSGLDLGVDGDTLTASFEIESRTLLELMAKHHGQSGDDGDWNDDDDDWDDDDEESERIEDLESKIRRLERLLEEEDG